MPNSLPQFQYQVKTEPTAKIPADIGLPSGSWSQPPPRVRQIQYQALAICLAIAEIVTPDKWFSPLSTPVRVSRDARATVALAASGSFQSESQQFAETVTESRWHQPFTDPPRFLVKRGLGTAYQSSSAFSPVEALAELSGEARFHQPWSEPVRTKRLRDASQQTLAFVKADPFPEEVQESKWHQPWSTPVRAKVTLRAATQTSTVGPLTVDSARTVSLLTVLGLEGYGVSRGGPYTGKTPATGTDWWGGPPLSEPLRTTTRWTAKIASGAIGPVLDPNTFELRWHQQWSTPIVKPRLAARHQQFLAYSESQQFPETEQEDKWHQPWSEPAIFLKDRGLAAHQQRASAGVENVPAVIPWFSPLSDPVRLNIDPRRASALATSGLSYSESQQFPESITEDRWHQPWSEPAAYLVKRGLAARYQQFSIRWDNDVPFNEVVTSDKWFAPLSLPVRVKIDPRRANALATSGPFYSESAQFPETVTESRWHQPWSEPIRHWARSLKPSQQQFAALGRPPVVSFSWFTTLSDPVRVKTRLPAGEQQTLAFNPQPFVNYSWFETLSEPVRHKLRFTEHPPPSYSQDDPPPPPPPPPPTGSGRRKDFPSYIPQPPYAAKKNPPFRPVWDERRRRAAQAILDEEKRRTAPAIPMPPAELFQRPVPVSYPMPGQVDPAQSQRIAQQSQDARDIADISDAMSVMSSDTQDAQDAIDILSIL